MKAPGIKVRAYFRMYYSHRKMLQINAPEAILESGKKLLDNMAGKLKKEHGFDIVRFMDTPQGQEDLHKVFIEVHSFEKASERCHICKAFTIHNGCKKKVISEEEAYPPVCKEFEPSGFSCDMERIQALMNRCNGCLHCQYDDEEGYVCRKKLDMDEIVCGGMEKKPGRL